MVQGIQASKPEPNCDLCEEETKATYFLQLTDLSTQLTKRLSLCIEHAQDELASSSMYKDIQTLNEEIPTTDL